MSLITALSSLTEEATIMTSEEEEQKPTEEEEEEQNPEPNQEESHSKKTGDDNENSPKGEDGAAFFPDSKEETDPQSDAQKELIANSTPTTDLEIALAAVLKRKENHVARLTAEIMKLKAFVSKRKQTYKRKRKDEGAPIRAMSAYNHFIRERFAELAKENEQALKSDDENKKLKRVPPSSLISKTGNEWKDLPEEVKAKYEER